jgi:hypothetical protein
MTPHLIKIKPIIKHHGLFICLVSIFCLIVLVIISQFIWLQAKLPLMFLISFSAVMLFLGICKLLEPKYSLLLTPDLCRYQHKKGHWQLPWHEIKAINTVTNTRGINLEQLAYVGVTLHNIDTLIASITPRLANQLIHEQKPLLAYCLSAGLITQQQATLNFEWYTSSKGEKLFGPTAGFLHQCHVLHDALGAHLFIAQINIDRSIEECVELLKRCKASSKTPIL